MVYRKIFQRCKGQSTGDRHALLNLIVGISTEAQAVSGDSGIATRSLSAISGTSCIYACCHRKVGQHVSASERLRFLRRRQSLYTSRLAGEMWPDGHISPARRDGAGAVVKAACLEILRSRFRAALWPSSFKERKCFFLRSLVKIQYCGEPPWPRGNGIGLIPPGPKFRILCQCHLIHLTNLRRFSWPSLAYMCTKVA